MMVEINEKKLRIMLEEHKSRGGELEKILSLLKKEVYKDCTVVKEEGGLTEPVKLLLSKCTEYFRHVGAIWTLEGILDGKEYNWKSNNPAS